MLEASKKVPAGIQPTTAGIPWDVRFMLASLNVQMRNGVKWDSKGLTNGVDSGTW